MKAKPKKKSREEVTDPHQAIYHFKIYLLNIFPMIYRRFKVKRDTHIAVKAAYDVEYIPEMIN
jgi:hypothetical protein